MNKARIFAISAALVLLIVLPMSIVPASAVVPNPNIYISYNIGGPQNSDLAFSYDQASNEMLQNIYEPLIWFDFDQVTKFVPAAATSWTIENINITDPITNMTYVQRYTFKLRDGMTFQYFDGTYTGEGSPVTVEDVEYTFERFMVMSQAAGAACLIMDPLLRIGGADPADPKMGRKIDFAVQSNATAKTVSFYLVMAYDPFLQVLAQPYGAIMCKEWNIDQTIHLGNWPGVWPDWTQPSSPTNNWTAWTEYFNPDLSPIELDTPDPPGPHLDRCLGSGAYMLDYWTVDEFQLKKNPTYWKGWSGKHVDTFIVRWGEWEQRKAAFIAGDVDVCTVPYNLQDQLYGVPGILSSRANFQLYCLGIFFVANVDPNSQYCGTMPPNGTFNGIGFPSDGFTDINLRKAFRALFPYDPWISAAYVGEASQPATCIVGGLAYHNPSIPKPLYSKTLAIKLLKEAWGGSEAIPGPVWTNGFTMRFTYNSENTMRQKSCEMLANEFANLGIEYFSDANHFRGIPTGEPWSSYKTKWAGHLLPLYVVAWGADFADPHNFVVPFMETNYGNFAYFQGFHNETINQWIYDAMATGVPSERQALYDKLAWAYLDNCYSIALAQPLIRHWIRDWVQGWWYHNIYAQQEFAYYIWKEDPSTVVRSITAEVFTWSGSGSKFLVKLRNAGVCPERVEAHITGTSTVDLDIWMKIGEVTGVVVNIVFPTGTYGISQFWIPAIQPLSNVPTSSTTMKAGDYGSGMPPAWYILDGLVTGSDLALFIAAYKKLATPQQIALVDLGSGMPPAFGAFDGKVDGSDLALFIACFKGLGP